MRTHPIGQAQQSFLDDVCSTLDEADDLTVTAGDLAEIWDMHPSTVRTWLHHGYELGILDRARRGRNYVYRLARD